MYNVKFERNKLRKGRFQVSYKSNIDIPDTKSYRNIAKLRLGYTKLKDYQHEIGNTDNNLCTCGEIERMRTNIFNMSGISDLNCDLLLGCSKKEFRDICIHVISPDFGGSS